MKTSETIISVLGGVIVGAALGILFAPDKGENTRKKIAKKGNDARNKAMGGFHDLFHNMSEKCNSMIHNGEHLAHNGISDLKKGLEAVKKDNK